MYNKKKATHTYNEMELLGLCYIESISWNYIRYVRLGRLNRSIYVRPVLTADQESLTHNQLIYSVGQVR